MSIEFPKNKQFTVENLEQKCLKGNILAQEIIYFSLTSLEVKEPAKQTF